MNKCSCRFWGFCLASVREVTYKHDCSHKLWAPSNFITCLYIRWNSYCQSHQIWTFIEYTALGAYLHLRYFVLAWIVWRIMWSLWITTCGELSNYYIGLHEQSYQAQVNIWKALAKFTCLLFLFRTKLIAWKLGWYDRSNLCDLASCPAPKTASHPLNLTNPCLWTKLPLTTDK